MLQQKTVSTRSFVSPACRPANRRSYVRVRSADAGKASRTAVDVRRFLHESLPSLGRLRFIVQGEGCILESVADTRGFKVKFTDLPQKGTLATLCTEDKTFEAHLYLSKVHSAKLAQTKAKHGDWEMYAMRFVDSTGKVLLSCLLASDGAPGVYAPEAVSAFKSLQQQYGEAVEFN